MRHSSVNDDHVILKYLISDWHKTFHVLAHKIYDF